MCIGPSGPSNIGRERSSRRRPGCLVRRATGDELSRILVLRVCGPIGIPGCACTAMQA